MITLDLSCIPVEAVILCVDYFSAKQKADINVAYECNSALIDIDDNFKKDFFEDLNDFVKRVIVADKNRKIKEIIIGRALYGILN